MGFMHNTKIAIYGLGNETQKAIPTLEKDYEIVGLLDGFKTDGEIYNYPIISFEQALANGIKDIIVVARPGSCKAIAKRIGDDCRANNIALFDFAGKDLLQDNKVVFNLLNIQGYSYSEILESAQKHDVISFDLFDTLAVRNTLLSSDVLEITAAKLNEHGKSHNEDLTKKRLASEKQLSVGGKAPRLNEIYRNFIGDDEEASEYANMEFETDLRLLIPRREVLNLMAEIKNFGKKVYITSDTYYSQEQIIRILNQIGVNEYDGLILSCENNTSKSGDLYEALKKQAGSDNILHIGDDSFADVDKAKEHGIDSVMIYSAADIYDLLGGLGLSDYEDSLSDRIRIGTFIAGLFNSPFQFEDVDRKLRIHDAAEIGYLLCAPIIVDFVLWFNEQIAENRFENIWFAARDGYLIRRLFELIDSKRKSDYFLTSRISAIRAGVSSKEDISDVDKMKFSGSAEDCLMTRFGLDSRNLDQSRINPKESGLLQYAESILESSKEKRTNYLKYIDSLNPKDGETALFDFVAKGTSQYFLNRVVKNNITGFYFMQLEPDYGREKSLDIIPFYTEEERVGSAIFDNYYVLETILTSPEPSLDEFDSEGNPVYAEETRTRKDISCVMLAQSGVVDYAKKYFEICPKGCRKINKKLDECILRMIHNMEITDKDFMELFIEDPFFNRNIHITDIV